MTLGGKFYKSYHNLSPEVLKYTCLCSTECTVYTVHYTLCTCVYSLLSILIVQCKVFTIQGTILSIYNEHIMHNVHCEMCIVQRTPVYTI